MHQIWKLLPFIFDIVSETPFISIEALGIKYFENNDYKNNNILNSIFYAEKNNGAYFNNQRIKVEVFWSRLASLDLGIRLYT